MLAKSFLSRVSQETRSRHLSDYTTWGTRRRWWPSWTDRDKKGRPRDAIATFFAADGIWNEAHRRHETHSATHGLYWYWLEKGKAVMVVTCFRLEVK